VPDFFDKGFNKIRACLTIGRAFPRRMAYALCDYEHIHHADGAGCRRVRRSAAGDSQALL
jgi:hypothetical protein